MCSSVVWVAGTPRCSRAERKSGLQQCRDKVQSTGKQISASTVDLSTRTRLQGQCGALQRAMVLASTSQKQKAAILSGFVQ